MSDERSAVIVQNGGAYPFQDVLYRAVCRDCKEPLEWEADLDADGTTYHVVCCKQSYFLRPHTYACEIEAAEDEE